MPEKRAANVMSAGVFFAAGALITAQAGVAPPPSLPHSMVGVWGSGSNACANVVDDGRVVVDAHSASFQAAIYQLQTIQRLKKTSSVHTTAVVREEGYDDADQPRTIVEIKFTLMSRSRLKIETASGVHEYTRCVK